jgi:hypothetical protein
MVTIVGIGLADVQMNGLAADLYEDEKVDFADYSILADFWRDYCPDSRPLK